MLNIKLIWKKAKQAIEQNNAIGYEVADSMLTV